MNNVIAGSSSGEGWCDQQTLNVTVNLPFAKPTRDVG